MSVLKTEILIDAEMFCVWQVLSDFDRYHEWNPFLIAVSGELKVGEKLQVTARPRTSIGRTFSSTVTYVEEGREFRWINRLGIPFLLDGEHIFRLDAVSPGTTRFIHEEVFCGVLLPLHRIFRWKYTMFGFKDMNIGLKRRVELLK